jgi:hypothetical protein
MLAYGWANTVPPRTRASVFPPEETPVRRTRMPAVKAEQVVTLPTNPARRHRPA